MDHKESLHIISDMVQLTRARLQIGDGTFFLLWGYLSVAAALLHAVLLMLAFKEQWAAAAWFLMFFGWIYQMIYLRQRDTAISPLTFVDRLVRQIWLVIMVPYILSLGLLPMLGNALYFVLLLFLAVAVYLTGWVLRFKPLCYGSYAIVMCAIPTLWMSQSFSLMFFALAMVLGYIIPGHLINRQANG